MLCKNLAIHAAFCNFATVANLDMQFFSTCAIEQLDHFCFSTLEQKFPLTMENFFPNFFFASTTINVGGGGNENKTDARHQLDLDGGGWPGV